MFFLKKCMLGGFVFTLTHCYHNSLNCGTNKDLVKLKPVRVIIVKSSSVSEVVTRLLFVNKWQIYLCF